MPVDIRKDLTSRLRASLQAGAVLIMLIAWACAGPQSAIISEPILQKTDEQRLWRQAVVEQEAILRDGAVSKDPAASAYVNEVIARLRPVETSDHLAFRAHILEDPFMNAFAYPNGVIFITSGLLACLENEAQLAALLGHEMAHCIGRHALRTYRFNGSQRLAQRHDRQVVAADDAGGPRGLADWLRTLELEADALSLDMLVKAHYHPQEGLNVFNHQRDALAADGLAEDRLPGAHPHWQERVNALKERLVAAGSAAKAGERRTAVYRERLQDVFLQNARLNLRLGRYRWARRDLGRFLKSRPQDAAGHYLLGESFRQEGGLTGIQKAQECFLAAIRLDGAHAPAYKALGLLHFKQGRRQLARQYLATGLALAPADADSAFIAQYLAQCESAGE